MIIRVVEIAVIQRQLSRAIRVVRAVVITRQLLHPRQHQLLHRHQPLHRHQLLHLSQSQSQSRMYGIVLGRELVIITMQLAEVAMSMVRIIMQVFVVYGVLIEFPLATQRQVLGFRFGY